MWDTRFGAQEKRLDIIAHGGGGPEGPCALPNLAGKSAGTRVSPIAILMSACPRTFNQFFKCRSSTVASGEGFRGPPYASGVGGRRPWGPPYPLTMEGGRGQFTVGSETPGIALITRHRVGDKGVNMASINQKERGHG
jgi:hypothetical protein